MASEMDRTPSRALIAVLRLLVTAVSRILWRIEFHGTQNIPNRGGFIVASNHPTYFDPFWISLPIKADLRYLAWDRAFQWPLAGRIISRVGAIPVSLEKGGTFATLKNALELLRRGRCLVIFPEGEREFENGELLPFKTGAVQLALKTGVPILPVSIVGANRIWPRGKKLPRLGKVDVYYHPLIEIPERQKGVEESEIVALQNAALRDVISWQNSGRT